MHLVRLGILCAVLLIPNSPEDLKAAAASLDAQNAPSTPAQPATTQQVPDKPVIAPVNQGTVIRRSFDVISTDIVVRDNRGRFIADLKDKDFELYEDGIKQDVVSFVLVHGGRVFNSEPKAAVSANEGIILPPSRPTNDAAGRIWVIFVDDLHLDFSNTARIKALFKQISNELVHDGDMFSIVSTGPSSVAINLTYDRKRLTEALDKISGAGLKANDILDTPVGAQGPPEVRYRAHVSFETAYDILKTLEQVHNRRKAFVYVSNGYDFDPFSETRKKNDEAKRKEMNPNAGSSSDNGGTGSLSDANDVNPFLQQGNEFSFADLASELTELTREANRANTTIYAIDPRGLVGMPDLDQKVEMMDFQNHVRTSQDSLRVIAEGTGGFATINQNDFRKALARIDAETSDYYVLGYYSSNPDPTIRKRRIEVKVNRPNVALRYRTEYTLKPTKAPEPRPKMTSSQPKTLQ
jgi:VWFA-related protein